MMDVVGSFRTAYGASIVMRTSLVAALTLGTLASCTGKQAGEGPATPSVGGVSGGTQVSPSAKPLTDYSSFIHGLEAAGSTVREGKRTGGDLFTVTGQTIFVDDVQASVYEYPSESALDAVRSSVSRDGYSIPTRTGGIAIVEMGRNAPPLQRGQAPRRLRW